MVAFQLSIPERQFMAAATVHAVTSPGSRAQHIDLAVHSGAATIAFSVTTDGHAVDAVVAVNGHPFATITGDAAHPDIRSASGRSLTPDEIHALGGIMELVGHVLEMFDGLLKPVAGAFALADVASH
jgi:hypothetical protein